MSPVKPWLPIIPSHPLQWHISAVIHHKQESRMGKEKHFYNVSQPLDRLWRGVSLAEKSTYEKSRYTDSNTFPIFCQVTAQAAAVLCASHIPQLCGFMPRQRNYNNQVQRAQKHELLSNSITRECVSVL